MSHIMTLEKILHVRENEKKNAQKAHHQSIKSFEDVATKLYNLLRKKEAAEDSYESSLQSTTTITEIKQQVLYIEQLNKHIVQLQDQVNQARSMMEKKQQALTHAHVEVKKFEKIIEHRHQERKDIEQKQENASMDEISIQQYLSRKNR
ncbi:MAG TPA: flagellar export protein FliJ [Virgibacillus sp.]|nr:flagellar export protein FliJ [Virgibacillus sp.]